MIRQLVLLFSLLTITFSASVADECHETVVIDSVEYVVGPQWCGKKFDSTQLAQPERLVRIPEEHCFEEYRIYVDIDTRDSFVQMADSAEKDGFLLIVDSGYRSARYQARIIAKSLDEGVKFKDITRFVAPPGYSDHETGRTVDMVPSDASFARTDTYRWLQQNAGNFGFVENFPKDTTDLMPWEPWHWTYLPTEK